MCIFVEVYGYVFVSDLVSAPLHFLCVSTLKAARTSCTLLYLRLVEGLAVRVVGVDSLDEWHAVGVVGDECVVYLLALLSQALSLYMLYDMKNGVYCMYALPTTIMCV